jgi:steroid Delta-isomerase
MQTQSESLRKAIHYFETISPATVATIEHIYSMDAYFKDPFNEVRGVEPIRAIFAHMFVKVDKPRFVVLEAIEQNGQAFLAWDFLLTFKGEQQERKIHGSSHLRFDPSGKISYHRDYWDVAQELYEQLPVLGSLMRFLKRRASQ